MGIKPRHIRYAFLKTAFILAVFGALVAWKAVFEKRALEDLLWGGGVGLLIWFAFFVYWIWRAQKRRADEPPPGEW